MEKRKKYQEGSGFRTDQLDGSGCVACPEELLKELPQGFVLRPAHVDQEVEPLVGVKEWLEQPVVVGQSDAPVLTGHVEGMQDEDMQRIRDQQEYQPPIFSLRNLRRLLRK